MRKYLLFSLITIITVFAHGQRSAFFDLAESYANNGDFDEAIRLMKLSYEMDKNIPGNEEECLDELSRLTFYYSQLDNQDSTSSYSNKAWMMVSQMLDNNPEIACLYGQNIVISLFNVKCDSLALYYGKLLLPAIHNLPESEYVIGEDDWAHYLANINSSQAYEPKSEFDKLDFELRENLNKDDLRNAQNVVNALKEWMSAPNRTSDDLISGWLALSGYYMRIGDKFAAKTLVEMAWSTIRQENREPTFDEIMSRINIEKEIPINSDWLIETTDSLLHSKEFANRWSKRFSEQALADRAYLLEACGWGYDHKGETLKAKDYIAQSLEYQRTQNRLNKLGTLSLSLQDYRTATKCFTEIIDSLGFENVRDDVVSNLCASYWLDNNKHALEEILPQYFQRRKNKVIDCFGFMTADEREMFVSSNPVGGWFETALATAFSSSEQQWSIGNKLAYNLALWRKGLLLESNRDFQQILDNLPEETHQLTERYHFLHSQYIDNSIPTDSVQMLWDIERQLMKYVEQDSTYLSSLRCSWKDIQNNLPFDGAAIEFVETAIPNNSDIAQSKIGIGALIITPEFDYPRYVFFGSNNDLAILTPYDESGKPAFDILYDKENAQLAYEVIWKPIEPYLSNTKKVFYSPDGLIHNINLDYLQDNQGKYMYERYDINRVSSTRQILNSHSNSTYDKHDALFGDIAYSPEQSNGVNRTRAIARNGFDFLDGTKLEITEINTILTGAKFKSYLHLKDDATEDNFRKLSGHSPEIVHVATHGFYYSADEAAHEDTYVGLFAQFSGMYRSGLAFKDAQIKWKNPGKLSDSSISPYDGILLSQELSSLDFSNTRLAVLSACQTANGQNDYDGVIGLQRGFKLAGVKSLLMSLWPVDDAATQLLMIQFYKNYTKNNSMRNALHKAQEYVRQSPGFERPEYWAGWILLDALN